MIIFSQGKEGKTPDISVIIVNETMPSSNVNNFLKSTARISSFIEAIIITCKIEKGTDIHQYICGFLNDIPPLSKMTIVVLDFHEGPARKRNIGASLSTSPYLLFADDDSEVFDDVAPLLRFLKEGSCQGAQPLILKLADKSTVDSAGDFLVKRERCFYSPYSRGEGMPVHELQPGLKIEEIPSMRSAFMIVQKKAYLDIGGFDDSFDFIYEDVDFGWRMVSAGYRLLFVPKVVALHKGGATTDPILYDQEAVNQGLLNFYAMHLKINSIFLWPYIIMNLQKEMVFRLRLKRVGVISLSRKLVFSNRLFIERVKQAFLHRQLLNRDFGFKGRKRLEDMANGLRFYFSQS